MIAATDDTSHEMSLEGVRKFTNLLVTADSTGAVPEAVHRNIVILTTIHAWLMWVSWELMALVQMLTGRYMKHHFEIRQTLHTASGLLLVFTMFSGMIIMWQYVLGGFTYAFIMNGKANIAGIGGSVEVFLGIAVAIGGIVAEVIRKYLWKPWSSSLMLGIKKAHKYLGITSVIYAQVAINAGIHTIFAVFYQNSSWAKTLALSNLIFVIVLYTVLEIRHRRIRKGEDPFVKAAASMTIEEFEKEVAAGQQLVVLDEYVLDVSRFVTHHPGG